MKNFLFIGDIQYWIYKINLCILHVKYVKEILKILKL